MISVNLFSAPLRRARTRMRMRTRTRTLVHVCILVAYRSTLEICDAAFRGNVRVRSTRSAVDLMQRAPIREKYRRQSLARGNRTRVDI
jgi:hypothetical protein